MPAADEDFDAEELFQEIRAGVTQMETPTEDRRNVVVDLARPEPRPHARGMALPGFAGSGDKPVAKPWASRARKTQVLMKSSLR